MRQIVNGLKNRNVDWTWQRKNLCGWSSISPRRGNANLREINSKRDRYLKPMDPEHTAHNYDAIASWWLEQMRDSTYGMAALERTLTFVGQGRHALDVGCGCGGRFLRVLLEQGFDCTGLDISQEMIALAKQRYPKISFVVGDVCIWALPRQYRYDHGLG